MFVFLTAASLALPITGIVLMELTYLWFGLTGGESPIWFVALSASLAFVGAGLWSMHGARRPATVVRRGARLGVLVSLLLPVDAVLVLWLWERASDRPDLGMGGLMLYNMPIIALVAALIFGALFALCGQWAERRLRRTEVG